MVPEKVPVPVPEKFGPGTGNNSGYRHTLIWTDTPSPMKSVIIWPDPLPICDYEIYG